MSAHLRPVFIAGWARSAVVARDGAFKALQAHDIAAPVLQSMLRRVGISPESVDALVLGNALGAGGNPARMAAFAAGLPDSCATFSVDTQCCSGLDAVALGVGLIRSGQASVVVAGGAEAWSRSPIRQLRPMRPADPALTYERPPFCPDPARDPDLLVSAAEYARRRGFTRNMQDAYAMHSHALGFAHAEDLADEIVAIEGIDTDTYPRVMTPERAARLPVQIAAGPDSGFALSRLAVSTQADGAAFVLLVSDEVCDRLGLQARFAWHAQVSLGADPVTPLLSAGVAARAVLRKADIADINALFCIELHDAFAAQGLGFCEEFGLATEQINSRGGGLARGHPIGASGAIALVRVLADMSRSALAGDAGMAVIAGAGGLGSAIVVKRSL